MFIQYNFDFNYPYIALHLKNHHLPLCFSRIIYLVWKLSLISFLMVKSMVLSCPLVGYMQCLINCVGCVNKFQSPFCQSIQNNRFKCSLQNHVNQYMLWMTHVDQIFWDFSFHVVMSITFKGALSQTLYFIVYYPLA